MEAGLRIAGMLAPAKCAIETETASWGEALEEFVDVILSGDTARVTLKEEGGAEQVLDVDSNSLLLSRGDDVAEGDQIGVTRHWAAGPLAWGLWTTLWLSVVCGLGYAPEFFEVGLMQLVMVVRGGEEV